MVSMIKNDHKKTNRNQLAFTLMELMLVVGIIAFLAGIAIPGYRGYQQKARQAEAAIMLVSLYNAQLSYQTQKGSYSSQLQGAGGVDWKPAGYRGGGAQESFYYTYGFYLPGAQEGMQFFTGKLGAPKEALMGTSASQNGFVAAAAAPGSQEGCYDLWLINHDKQITHQENVTLGHSP